MLLSRVGGVSSSEQATEGQSSRGCISEGSGHWKAFTDKLKKWDYFQGHLEGSKVYRERLATAMQYYQRQWSSDEKKEEEECDEDSSIGDVGSVKYLYTYGNL